MRLWRLTRFPALDGEGGRRASARWQTKGRPIIYTATSPAGALIEVLVHLDVEPDELPDGYWLVEIEVPGAYIRSALAPRLPSGWKGNHQATRAIGDKFLKAGKRLACRVPSAIIRATDNFLLNPAYPGFGNRKQGIVIGIRKDKFIFDPRLI